MDSEKNLTQWSIIYSLFLKKQINKKYLHLYSLIYNIKYKNLYNLYFSIRNKSYLEQKNYIKKRIKFYIYKLHRNEVSLEELDALYILYTLRFE